MAEYRAHRMTKPNIPQMKKDAKRALKALRTGDEGLIAEVRSAYPNFRDLPDVGIVEGMTLMNMQHVVARRNGFLSWRDALDSLEGSF